MAIGPSQSQLHRVVNANSRTDNACPRVIYLPPTVPSPYRRENTNTTPYIMFIRDLSI